jgi:hypothetical protein
MKLQNCIKIILELKVCFFKRGGMVLTITTFNIFYIILQWKFLARLQLYIRDQHILKN